MQYSTNETFMTPKAKANVVIAAFTTSHARLRLFKTMERLGMERLLYYDTGNFVSQKYITHAEFHTSVIQNIYRETLLGFYYF